MPDADKSRKVYRIMLETVRTLDNILKKKRAYRDVFLPESISLRNKLKEYCERLMFYDPSEYGRKAEELLWRKVFYDIIQLMKHNKKNMRPNVNYESAFRTHLVAATGYYHHLLLKLQNTFNLRLNGIVDFNEVFEHKSHFTKPMQNKKKDEEKLREWATRACHRCLVYLGDLARYQQDYDGLRSRVLSQRYYLQALALCPDIGMAFNQLGTLSGNRYYGCEAGYYYMRCMMCQSTFEGAHGNLNRLFEKNQKRFADLVESSPRVLPPEQQRPKDIKRFLVRFMQLLNVLQSGSQGPESGGDIQEQCQNTLHDFNLCMMYQPPPNRGRRRLETSHDDRPQYLDDGLVMQIVVMVMTTIYKQNKAGSKMVSAAIAFAMAIFSHIFNHALMRLQGSLYEAENAQSLLHTDGELSFDDDDDLTPDDLDIDHETGEPMEEQESPSPDGSKKKKRRRRRRRRRVSQPVAENASEESDLSEGEHVHEEKDVAMLSGDSDEDMLNYMDNSDSSSETDDLMESQELRPGFAVSASPEQLEGQLERLDLQALQKNYSGGVFSADVSNENQVYLDSLEAGYSLSLDWQQSSSAFMQNDLGFHLFPGLNLVNRQDSDSSDNEVFRAVMQGKKMVNRPPGFDKDPESAHVEDITQKIANFAIETDTDTSLIPTDTDNSSLPTESEHGDTEVEELSDTGSVIDKTELLERRLHRLLDVVSGEGLLPTVKLICDWLKCHQSVVTTTAKSSQSLWSRLSLLLNFLPAESLMTSQEVCQNSDVTESVCLFSDRPSQWNQHEALVEDVVVRKLPPLMDAHAHLSFKRILDLSDRQEAILRVCCLRKFGQSMAKIAELNLKYDAAKRVFIGPLQHVGNKQPADAKAAQQEMADAEARRNQLMKDMAQLRLRAEVSQLEGSLKTVEEPSLPPYVVPDASALTDCLPAIRQMCQSSRFIIIIPLAVIDKLDVVKKESSGARETIRWLEAEFRKGSRYVRAQKTHERTSGGHQHKSLKKKDPEAWTLSQITDCCRYLSRQNVEYDPKGMVTILTNQKLASPDVSLKVRQAAAAAEKEGFYIHNVNDFHKKWKEYWKSKS